MNRYIGQLMGPIDRKQYDPVINSLRTSWHYAPVASEEIC